MLVIFNMLLRNALRLYMSIHCPSLTSWAVDAPHFTLAVGAVLLLRAVDAFSNKGF